MKDIESWIDKNNPYQDFEDFNMLLLKGYWAAGATAMAEYLQNEDWKNQLQKLPRLNNQYDVEENGDYIPTLYFTDGLWFISWMHFDDAESILEYKAETIEEVVKIAFKESVIKTVKWMCHLKNGLKSDIENMRQIERNDKNIETSNDQQLKRWRAKEEGTYYHVYNCVEVQKDTEYHSTVDDDRYNAGNYFQTEAEAEAVVEAFKKILEQKNND